MRLATDRALVCLACASLGTSLPTNPSSALPPSSGGPQPHSSAQSPDRTDNSTAAGSSALSQINSSTAAVAVCFVLVAAMVGGLVFRKLFSKKHKASECHSVGEPPLKPDDSGTTPEAVDGDSSSIRSWIVRDSNDVDDDDDRIPATPSVTIVSSKFNRPSEMESPFSPTRKHILPESQQTTPKIKGFHLDVVSVMTDWPHISERDLVHTWGASSPAPAESIGATHFEGTRSSKSIDVKSLSAAGGSMNHSAWSTNSKQNTVLGAMPFTLQERLATPELELQNEQEKPEIGAVGVPPVPAIPLIYTSPSNLKVQAGLEPDASSASLYELRPNSMLSPFRESPESGSTSRDSWNADLAVDDQQLSPAPSSLFMEILETNEELEVEES